MCKKVKGWGHTRTRIRIQHSNTLLTGTVLEEALLGAVLGGASQTREIDENGDLGGGVLVRLRG